MALNKTLSFDLELKPGGIPPIIHASQGDIGRMFKANIYWDGSAATSYVSGATVNLRGNKPDKTVFDYTATLAGSMVTFETTEQMTIISGPVECELVFSQDGDVIASANFLLIVEASPYDPNNLSESDVEGLTDVLAGFQRLNRDSNGVVKIGGGVTASGTAEPIKGFYVHDEETDTDGVAKVSIEAVHEFVEDVSGAVDSWLDEHPEATTTVQDDSLTTAKYKDGSVTEDKLAPASVVEGKVNVNFLKEIKNAYVTPEMFGAVGDGTTDDTAAIKSAISSGKQVYLAKVYKITETIVLPSNIRLFGDSAHSGSDSPQGLIIATGCDAFHIQAGTRFICLTRFRIVSDFGGVVFVGSGTITRLVFDELTLTCEYDFTDSFANGVSVTSAVSLWNVEFNNISSYINDNGNNYAFYLDANARSFAIKFRNVVTGDKSVYLGNISSIFDSCNFGFDLATKITTTASSYLEFVNCNFEDDEDGESTTKLDLGSTQIIFDRCQFQTRAPDTNKPWFVFRSSIQSVIFDNCFYRLINDVNNFWLPAGNFMVRAGSMQFVGYNSSIPQYTNDAQKTVVSKNPGIVANIYNPQAQLVETNAFGVHDGQLAYYNGTKWIAGGSKTQYGAPTNPYNGQLWTNGSDLKTYVWYGNGWFDMMGNRYTSS